MGSAKAKVIGITFCVALASLVIVGAHADEIDDILDVEGIMQAKERSKAVSKAAPAPRPVSTKTLEKRLRVAKIELSAARTEIDVLKNHIRAQDVRHRTELLFAHYNMGCVYKASRQYERAEKEFLKALEIKPDDAAVHYNLGILYDDDLGRKKSARKHYTRFIELAPDDRDVLQVREWLDLLDR